MAARDEAGGTGSARRRRERRLRAYLAVCTDERRNGRCRVSAPQRTAPEEGKGPGVGE